MNKEKAIIDNLNDERVATLVEKETLEDKIEPKGMSDFGNERIGHIAVKNVKEKIQNVQRRLKEAIGDSRNYSDEIRAIWFKEEVITKIFNEEIGEGLL